jgi:6-phosphogluconolactonase
MTVEIEVVPDPARACAAMMVGAAADGGHVVLTGGSTPRVAYQEFVQAVTAVDVDLSRTTFWFGDERCVPPDDERANYGMAKAALLDLLGDRPVGRVVRMKGELGPEEGAADYERELAEAGRPEFDLLLLGIGPDGHTASMFPDQESLSERSRLVAGVAMSGLEPFVPRITLTLPGLALARHAVVLAVGDSKADAIAAAFGPDAKPDPHVPSSLLPSTVERLTVLIDPAAAAHL